jgi:hypothetical protein
VLTAIDEEPKSVMEAFDSGRTPWLKKWNPCTRMRCGIWDGTWNLEIERMDVKTMFLHGDLEE